MARQPRSSKTLSTLIEGLEPRLLLAADYSVAYEDFSDTTGLWFFDETSVSGDSIELTPPQTSITGGFWHSRPLDISAEEIAAGFSTSFVFRTSRGTMDLYSGGDGFTLLLNGSETFDPTHPGIWRGLYEIPGVRLAEIFTRNPANGAPLNTINGVDPGFDLGDGAPKYVWIEYEASTQTSRLFVSQTEVQPTSPLHETQISTHADHVIGRLGFVGGTSAYSGNVGGQYIDAWTIDGFVDTPTAESQEIVRFNGFTDTDQDHLVLEGNATINQGQLHLGSTGGVWFQDQLALGGALPTVNLARSGDGFFTRFVTRATIGANEAGHLQWQLSSIDPNGETRSLTLHLAAADSSGANASAWVTLTGETEPLAELSLNGISFPEEVLVHYDPLAAAMVFDLAPSTLASSSSRFTLQIDLMAELGDTASIGFVAEASHPDTSFALTYWSLNKVLPPPGALYRLIDPDAHNFDHFGTISLVEGDHLAIGSRDNDEPDEVYIFDARTGELDFVIPHSGFDGLQSDGQTIVVQGHYFSGWWNPNIIYTVRLYDWESGEEWPISFESEVISSNGGRVTQSDHWGHSVHLDQGRIVIGGPGKYLVTPFEDSGAIGVFDRDGQIAMESGYSLPSSRLGREVVLTNDHVLSVDSLGVITFTVEAMSASNSLYDPVEHHRLSTESEAIESIDGIGELGFLYFGQSDQRTEVFDLNTFNLLTVLDATQRSEWQRDTAIDPISGVAKIGGRYFDLTTRAQLDSPPTGFNGTKVTSDGGYAILGEPNASLLYREDGTALVYDLSGLVSKQGDLNADALIDGTDLEALYDGIRSGRTLNFDEDVMPDRIFDAVDVQYWVEGLFGSRLGDLNLDGRVDLVDLDVLGQNFGQSASAYGDGDLNVDGIVDLADLDIMGRAFGFGTDDGGLAGSLAGEFAGGLTGASTTALATALPSVGRLSRPAPSDDVGFAFTAIPSDDDDRAERFI